MIAKEKNVNKNESLNHGRLTKRITKIKVYHGHVNPVLFPRRLNYPPRLNPQPALQQELFREVYRTIRA